MVEYNASHNRYQFAMPVRWSETQSVLFDKAGVEKLVEFGPSTTLLNMANKTLAQFNQESDAVNGLKRSLLSISTNYDDLRYDTLPPVELERKESPKLEKSPDPKHATEPIALEAPIHENVPPAKGNLPIPDVPITALESVSALVASSLKRPASDLKLGDSIKAVSGGRSIVQNEIVGDMLEEFGPLADDVENVPLEELASIIQKSYDGRMRKCLRARVEKMISSKMPGSFDLISARSFLEDKWRLASGRQDAVLLIALGQQPAARLKKNEEAEAFFDAIAQGYLTSAGLSRQRNVEAADPKQTLLDLKVVQQLRDEYSTLRKKVAALLSDDDESATSPSQTSDNFSQIQDKIDLYESELGEDFCNGIKPTFNADHQRSYESSWNWGHVDLIDEYYKLIGSNTSPRNLEAVIASLRGRMSGRLERTRQYLLSRISSSGNDSRESVKKLLEGLGSDNFSEEGSYSPSTQTSSPVIIPLSGAAQEAHPILLLEPTQIASSHQSLSQKLGNPGSPRILRRGQAAWKPDPCLTAYMGLESAITPTTFAEKNVLLTGAGPNSIGIALLELLLRGGARVLVTTSRAMRDAGPIYQEVFARHGARGSRLVVVPCNQGSQQDVERLVAHVYDPAKGLGWDLDFVVPFAAVPEKGREIDAIDSRSELAHRAMLTNVLRILGAVKAAKQGRGSRTRPAQVLLPLSPNHGAFGGDGLYSESKLGLTALHNKWFSESWSDYLCLCGVVIGWTRGTGLMAANDAIADEIAKRGIMTFSTEEMARHLAALMSGRVVSVCQTECLLADLSGGMGSDPGLAEFVAQIRTEIRQSDEIRRAISDEEALDEGIIRGILAPTPPPNSTPPISPMEDLDLGFPKLPEYATEIKPLNAQLDGMVDLESVVVVVGFAEIGPWGNSRTRWEMELNGELSVQGCIELAWMTGLIKHNPKPAGTSSPRGAAGAAWIDVETGAPIHGVEVKAKYEKKILAHAGLRLIEPSPLDHPDRESQQFLQEVVVQHDLEPFTASLDTATEFAREHGDKVDVRPVAGSDQYSVRLRRGATVLVPKARAFDRIVGGQLPTGWDPTAYGLPADLCESVDRCTQMALVCAAETFLSAGIPDVYELYGGMHPSELANCVGSGLGGGRSLQKLYRQRYLDRPVQSDILAEVFVNTTGAWLNMLLMGAAGPTRTPVGACATALESLNQGYDLIASGAARVCLVGGYDDMTQDTSAEFARMRATADSAADVRGRGRAPAETSRPCAASRCGFVEAEGCGMQLLASAQTALELGLPVRAVVAHVQTASDGVGRSVPAPGKGIMVNVREDPSAARGPSPLLDIGYRRRLLERALASIREHRELLSAPDAPEPSPSGSLDEEAELASRREEREARRRFGNGFWTHDARISPLRGALAVWGLTADDIGVASLHGTSTVLNEKNEVEVLHRQLARLGRTPGNAALAVCQKYLTGHPKGAAAAWMLNGCCQILDAGAVPGNRNADDIDAALEPWEHLAFPGRTIAVGDVRAFTVTSFGFGQKGAQALGVHPRFLFATVDEQRYAEYCRRRQRRYFRAKQHFQNTFYGSHMVVLKDDPPYPKERQVEALVDATARFG
ncbi:putative 3-oxoacyl-synthase [Durotheca rogersii]|uniref:putative 3-oxoacyl-synthase n=1 Tax=Durotheca rogersii TaxID=419775 RepID=UPI00221EEF12|nr:putative 3-oxoacyl-synthase [Durotheca rogersii]KAI5863026.1 putative 3-oxoacyl-synthase [Durotheca rogersii]